MIWQRCWSDDIKMNDLLNEKDKQDLKNLKKKSKAILSEGLPPGWTAHLGEFFVALELLTKVAPTGHLYYFHKATRKSTYIRPLPDASGVETGVIIPPPPPLSLSQAQLDQPLTKSSFPNVLGIPEQSFPIANAEPWVRVVTRRQRQFVHNPETGVSLWTPPKEVLSAMHEEEKGNNPLNGLFGYSEQSSSEYDSSEDIYSSDNASDASVDPNSSVNANPDAFSTTLDNTEYTEDDIAWQLAAMGNNDFNTESVKELSKDEKIQQFKEMLRELDINPYHPWDQEISKIMMDTRYLLIDTMKERKELFEVFCKESIVEQRKEAESRPKRDPKISFITLLQDPRTPNMYWHEFRRKFKKEQEYKDYGLNDKEREKLFREYKEQMKYDIKKKEQDFQILLRTTPSVTKETTLFSLPDEVLSDLRYAVIPSEKLEEYISKYTRTI
ncbi:hypothetical protein PMAC_002080 [Pneumocystis sp. 'macacae']|nr:hypothetical protein PMAC_002080 [Pneumocystis sp. 'macacae']